MRKVLITMACAATAGMAVLLVKEMPAIRRYIRIERM
ncbi:hypothetical protein FHX41_1368 [Actinomadura hallensis]|uniref:Uncharacterized protein n=1 Tax=Actinomadura hallensis TaxID=337895 RepID=A0A543IAZ6_9ACTN|nr:hypothetical protein FHX41_1368 [Actinomadura hallensis]